MEINDISFYFYIWIFLLVLSVPFFIMHHKRYVKLQKQRKEQGDKGEEYVSKILNSLSPDYFCIDDLLLRYKNNTHQIDHVIISRYGVFVLETKNFRGVIKGSGFDMKWKQINGDKSRSFYNPEYQNGMHCEVVSAVGKVKDDSIFPYVVFVGRCELQLEDVSRVIHSSEVLEKILEHHEVLIDDEKVFKIYTRLTNANINSRKAREAHKKRVQNIKLFTKA